MAIFDNLKKSINYKIKKRTAIKDLNKLIATVQLKENEWKEYKIPDFDWHYPDNPEIGKKIYWVKELKGLFSEIKDSYEKLCLNLRIDLNSAIKKIREDKGQDLTPELNGILLNIRKLIRIKSSSIRSWVLMARGYLTKYEEIINFLEEMKEKHPENEKKFEEFIKVVKDANTEFRKEFEENVSWKKEGIYPLKIFVSKIVKEYKEIINSLS